MMRINTFFRDLEIADSVGGNSAEEIVNEINQESQTQKNMVLEISGKSAASILVLLFRMLEMKEGIKLIVEESGEIYSLELRKITDLDKDIPKNLNSNIVDTIKVDIDSYK